MTVSKGQPAPDFELFGEFDRESKAYRVYRLGEALRQGPVILHFFPAPFTRVCERQMSDVRDHAEDVYGRQGVTVWGVTGHYPWLIGLWNREHHFGVPILADYEHTVSEDYVGTYPPEKMDGLRHTSVRGVIGVGTDGIVRFVWTTGEPTVGPTDEIVQEAIDASRA